MDTIIRNATQIPPMSPYAKPEHKRAAHVLVYALTLGDSAAWLGASEVWMACLSLSERAALAFSALKSMNPDDALLTAERALACGAGQPIAPLFNHMDEAAFWADMAEPDELKAYVLAAFNRLSAPDQTAFLNYVHGGLAA